MAINRINIPLNILFLMEEVKLVRNLLLKICIVGYEKKNSYEFLTEK